MKPVRQDANVRVAGREIAEELAVLGIAQISRDRFRLNKILDATADLCGVVDFLALLEPDIGDVFRNDLRGSKTSKPSTRKNGITIAFFVASSVWATAWALMARFAKSETSSLNDISKLSPTMQEILASVVTYFNGPADDPLLRGFSLAYVVLLLAPSDSLLTESVGTRPQKEGVDGSVQAAPPHPAR